MSNIFLPGQITQTSPYGRDVKTQGYPIRICELLATLDAPAYLARVTVNKVKNVRNAKACIKKAFENQIQGKGFSLVEVSSRVRAAGAKCAVYRAAEGISFEEDVAALGRFLKKLPKPAAAFVACDVRARDLLSACRLTKLTVPDDLAILSVDDDASICLHTTPTLSSIRQNAERGGYLAAAALDRAMRQACVKSSRLMIAPRS